jgi:outer membrane protein TolC
MRVLIATLVTAGLFTGWALSAQQRELSLREAVALALEANPEIQIERTRRDSAGALLRAAQGAFDPALRLEVQRRSARNPAASILEGANGRVDIKEWRPAAAVRQKLPWSGASWEAGWDWTRTSTTNPFTSLNPYYSPRATLGVNVPLGRFRATDRERTEVKVRQRERSLAAADFELKLIDIAARTEAAYWAWVAARAGLTAAREAMELAREAAASTERLVKEGDVAEAERAGAKTALARREESAAAAQEEMERAEIALRMLVTRDTADKLWSEVWAPGDLRATPVSLDEAAALRASERRPELRSSELREQMAELQARLAREYGKPAVDLSLSYASQGLAGREVLDPSNQIPGFPPLTAPPLLVGGLGQATRQVFRNRFPVYQAGISIDIPLRNRSAEGQRQEAELSLRRSRWERVQLEKLLSVEVRQTYAALRAAEARTRAARDAADAALTRLRSELRLLREGQANNLSVNVRQSEAAEASQLLVNAERGLNLAQAEARRVTGESLDFFGVTVQ